MRHLAISTGIILAVVGSVANAQESAGQTEFMNSCATCHGESGKGNGPFASLMNVPVPSLTTLSAQNDGKFPFLDTFMTIDGRTQVAGHGGPMPVWGDRYIADAAGDYGAYGAEVVTRGRILTLVNYLESLQE